MESMKSIIELLEKKAYKVKSDGSGIDNFNVDRNDPKIQVKRLSNGEVYDLHYKDEKQLEKGLANEKGFEKFDSNNVEGNLSLPKNEKLAAIVKKYAKPGMTKEDLVAAENEAGSRSNTRIVLAHIAKSLGLEGVYNQKGSFIYMKNGEPASARGGNLDQAKDVAEKGLLPDKVADKIQKVAEKNKERDPEKAKKFQDVIDASKGDQEDPQAQAGTVDYTDKIKAAQEILSRATTQAPAQESFRTLSYADQLLEEISGREAQELAAIMKELEEALPNITDDSQKQQIEALMRQYKEFQAGGAGDSAETKPDSGTGQIDTDSDSAIASAIKDPALWIKNEMPKELEAAQAKGLIRATNNGKKKSASAAAVQQILLRIGTANNNAELKKIKADGFYGPATIAGVKRAQELAGIKVDGDAGANTAQELVDYADNPQKGIDDSIVKDFARIKELVDKHNAEPTAQTSSIDFSMRSMLETLSRLDEALDDAEMQELKALIDKHRARMDDPEAGQQYSQEQRDLFKTADQLGKAPEDPQAQAGVKEPPAPEAVTNHDELADALYAAGYRMFGTDEEKIYRYLEKIKDKASYDKVAGIYQTKFKRKDMTADLQAEMSGQQLEQLNQILGKLGVGPNVGAGQGKIDANGIFQIPDEMRAELKLDTNMPKFANTKLSKNGAMIMIYHRSNGGSGPTIKVDSPEGQKLIKMIQDAGGKIVNPADAEKGKASTTGTSPQGMDPSKLANPKRPAPGTGSMDAAAGAASQQNASKDNSMKKAINEAASMNISMSGDNAGEVSELLNMLKNAGMPNAAPVGAMDMPMDMPVKVGPMDHDHDMPDESPCGSDDAGMGDMKKLAGLDRPMPEEDVEEDGWDNSPDEEYKDDDYMYQSGGIHKKKKAYPATQDGDNPMALETSIKEQLWAALNEKFTTEGRGRGRGKKAKEDIETTEGRGRGRGKKKMEDMKTTEGRGKGKGRGRGKG